MQSKQVELPKESDQCLWCKFVSGVIIEKNTTAYNEYFIGMISTSPLFNQSVACYAYIYRVLFFIFYIWLVFAAIAGYSDLVLLSIFRAIEVEAFRYVSKSLLKLFLLLVLKKCFLPSNTFCLE